MKQLLTIVFLLPLTFTAAAQTQNERITVTENIAYRTDVGASTVLDLAKPQLG